MCASLTTNILRIRRQCCVSVYVYQRCDVMTITSITCTLIFIVDHLSAERYVIVFRFRGHAFAGGPCTVVCINSPVATNSTAIISSNICCFIS